MNVRSEAMEVDDKREEIKLPPHMNGIDTSILRRYGLLEKLKPKVNPREQKLFDNLIKR